LSEQLGSLKITEDTLKNTTEYTNEISTAPANIQNEQIELLKNMVLNLIWFNENRTKFKDW